MHTFKSPIHPDYQHLLSFQIEKKTYKFPCLPFGLSTAPRVFTMQLKPVVGFLRQNRFCLIVLPNWPALAVGESGADCEPKEVHANSYSGVIFSGLLCVHTSSPRLMYGGASSGNPVRSFLGGIDNLIVVGNSTVCGESNCYNWSYPTSPTALVGPPDANEPVQPLNYTQEEILDKYDAILSLNLASLEDLQWWTTHTTAPVRASVCPPDPSIIVHSDASNRGWEAVLNSHSQTGGCGLQRKQITT